MLKNVRSELFFLKQYGISEKLLEFLYQQEMSPLDTVFNHNSLSHQEALKYFTKKDVELSNDLIKFQTLVCELKNYFLIHKQEKLYFKYDETIFSSLLSKHETPLFLYSCGDESLLSTEEYRVAIIGTRKPSKESIEKARYYATRLASSGIVIVSGLAEGIDTVAHTSTLDVGGKTIAVLPTNFANIYPKINEGLADTIRNKGVLISAIGPREHTYRSSFLDRNRIVAGIANEIFVVETGLNSGTMNTIRHAFESGKKISFLNQRDEKVNKKLLNYGGEMIE